MLLALLALLYGCCTEVDCQGMITVAVAGIPDSASSVSIEVREGSRSTTCTWEGEGEGSCDEQWATGSLADGTIEVQVPSDESEGVVDVTVHVSDAVALDTTVEPDWTNNRINGPTCGITCVSGNVELALEE